MTKETIALEMRGVLDQEFRSWYPLSIDTVNGGFYSDINYKWELEGIQDKMIVTQARHVWATANAVMFYQKDNVLRNIGGHGLKFLRTTMWDQEFGGFYDLVNRQGEPIKEDGQIIKRAYGNAFAIYGLAAYYAASGDTVALQLAQKTFSWLERHSYDSLHGGYFQFMSRDGTPLLEGYRGVPPKDQNSTIHLLECFTELYKVWPDRTLQERLFSLLRIVRDTITTDKGYMVLFFNRDWSPISYRDSSSDVREKNYEFDHVSFGHDVETAYLMLEASEALGLKNDTTTLRIAKKMVDHALLKGWDRDRGGLYDGGYYFGRDDRASIVKNTKEWWSQVEALNSFLMMSDLFPNDDLNYYNKFYIQWDYCKKYVIDSEHGGWYWGGVDIVPQNKYSPKGSIWKGNYHTSRALINCIKRLKQGTMTYKQTHFEPVNRNASPEARKLLEYLYSIRGTNVIAGHHSYIEKANLFLDRVKELTGKSPQIWGCDFINYYRKGNADQIVQEAYKKYKAGYFITLMWHVGRPQDDPPFGWKESVQAKMSDTEWDQLTTPGTNLHSRWLGQVDTIAGFLNELQVLGVPVLWRPYHELNGVWFWWGNRKGPNGSAKLYRMLFDRFVNHHKLNNLIWVWNTNAPRQLINDEAYAYEDFFPGLEYVDVLAADVYHHDYRQSHHDELAALAGGKAIALGEVGEVPTPEILAHQPLWAWFMIWGNFVDTHNTPAQIRDLYGYPGILTHEDFRSR
jgi:cellobiose epimerase